MTTAELEPLLRLALVEGIGPQRLTRLIERFGHAGAALRASAADLRAIPGVGSGLAQKIQLAGSERGRRAALLAMRRLDRARATTLTVADPRYPSPFLDLPDPPYLLFAAGRLELLDLPGIAVVGTRSPTVYGRTTATALSRDLALAGLSVVSGVARGIDSAAHQGALEAGGATIGVLGHGIEIAYPRDAAELFTRLRRDGLLLTEYPPGETPKAGNFPRRNRLITALSRGVIVIEMGLKSGAQHSVNFALEQGREVFAVPGPIGSPTSEGTNQLIKDGARMVTSAADVLEELYGVGTTHRAGGRSPSSLAAAAKGKTTFPPASTAASEILPSSTDPRDRSILEAIGPVPVTVDLLASSSRLDPPTLLARLLELELRGLVQSLPGQRWARAGARGGA